ncbi:MAG: three-Cys-motif partner protein TcmP [Anaerolineae bacterium]|nr:three-Cys-motif partner protein TcmP [Anaerolineae bacterium]
MKNPTGIPSFGGNWTLEKLERVGKYLSAYAKIMDNQPFGFAYIDAFAGTGYQELKSAERPDELLLPELAEAETQAFLDGSARRALQVRPEFTRYIFVEKDEPRFRQLQRLREDFPSLAPKITLVNADANAYLVDLCRNHRWDTRRAVLFLDPFGMQVEWDTIRAIAETQAIDMWYLFPLGIAVNRLLKRDAAISEPMRQRLDQIFGARDWFDVFYHTDVIPDLFDGQRTVTKKVANPFESIEQYFVSRLKSVFADAADKPLPLYNSRGVPLFLLCFAVGNKKGAKTAMKIANHILR